jgi:Putative zinc-finger
MDSVRLHSSERDLQLFADGELGRRHASKIERHLASCWDCRAHMAQTEGAITGFVTLRRKLLDQTLHGADFPSERASRAVLGARLAHRATSNRSSVWRKVAAAIWPVAVTRRPLWIAGCVVVVLAALLVLEPFLTPSVSAKEVIANGKAAEQRHSRGVVIHQRVRLRSKPRADAAEVAIDFDRWQDGIRSRILMAAGRSNPADRLHTLYQGVGADWENPLSTTSFARLRESLGEVRDQVRGRDEITVTSTPVRHPEDAGTVTRVQLTVRRSDWHAISQRIELGDADYELTELLDEALASGNMPAIFAEPPPAPSAAVLPAPPEASTPAIPEPFTPTSQQLDDAETGLREAFHQIGADIEEVPEILREGGQIRFRLFVRTTSRKEEILAALAGISFLAPEIGDAETGATEAQGSIPMPSAAASTRPPLYSTQPPLAKTLWDYSGGLEPANNYLNAVRDSYLGVLVDASALVRLAERYPDPEWDRLSPESQERLNRIARDHLAAVRNNLSGYLKIVSPVLDEMLIKQQFNAPGMAEPKDSACLSWRAAAGLLVTDLGSLQTSFRRLFVEERTEQPVAVPAAELLRQSVESRSRLQARQLCQP